MFSTITEIFTKFLQSSFNVVKAEDELVDPAKVLRVCYINCGLNENRNSHFNFYLYIQSKCEQQNEAKERFAKLQECNVRVTSKKQTAETCVEELWDFLEVVDKCVAKDLFDHLK